MAHRRLVAVPSLYALDVLPQNDRVILAIDPKYGIESFEDMRLKRPALRNATSTNDGTNFIGFVAHPFMESDGITADVPLPGKKGWVGDSLNSTLGSPFQVVSSISSRPTLV